MIDAFIFTKDRACQLHLLLESFRRNAPGLFRPYILWKASTVEYLRGYQQLMRSVDLIPLGTTWDTEVRHVREHFLDAMRWSRQCNNLFCIWTDDCIFYRPLMRVTASDVERAMDDRTICFSFRLGLNTIVQDYRTGRLQRQLNDWSGICNGDGERIIHWPWRNYADTDNYGYPIAMDGCCYRPEDLLELSEAWEFDTFRTWEGASNGPPRRDKIKKPLMASFDTSCVINNPSNSMQWPPLAAGHLFPFSAEDLNRKYLDGYVIDLDGFDFSDVRGCHQEFPLKFRKIS